MTIGIINIHLRIVKKNTINNTNDNDMWQIKHDSNVITIHKHNTINYKLK